MASYNKFECFSEDVCEKLHECNTDQFMVYLTNATPSASADRVGFTDLAEISAGNGYTAGGADTQNTGARSGLTYTVTGTKITWTASGGTIGPFRYAALYNNTAASDLLIAWWDYGSALTLNDGESFNWKPNNSDTTGTIFTLA